MSEIIFLIFIWFIIGFAFISHHQDPNTKSVGIVLLYMINFAQSYVISPVTYVLTGLTGVTTEATLLGFQQSTLALLAFAVGALLIEPRTIRQAVVDEQSPSKVPPDLSAASFYLCVGIFAFLASGFMPLSLRTLMTIMWLLLPVGLILLIWHYLRKGIYRPVFNIILLSLSMPLFTGFFRGFKGEGVAIVLALVVFVLIKFRFPWRSLAVLALLGYLGLSFSVSFDPVREGVRSANWDENSSNSRETLFIDFINNLQWFDIRKEEHFDALEGRVNQNYIIGSAVSNMKTNDIPFANGSTLRKAIIGIIPRAIWPNKPRLAGGYSTVTYYTNISFQNTSVGLGHIGDLYINFGTVGVMGGFLLLGILLARTDRKAAQALESENYQRFAMWYLVGSAFLIGIDISLAIISAAQALVIVPLLNRFVFPVFIDIFNQIASGANATTFDYIPPPVPSDSIG